ncbi:MAG: threonine--tRNA ligase, partial [Acidiferrobacteraceae bacterium]|nr:threonine--tRNA ligase [Acidiferrobacteraceae bacterium]
MPDITLPDRSIRSFDNPVTIIELARNIGERLAAAAVGGVVDDRLVDVSHLIQKNCSARILTVNDPEGLEILRHSVAHLLAHAVKELFPNVQIAIGPVIADGYYYDFAYPDGFSESDLNRIEIRMSEIINRKLPIERFVQDRESAINMFTKIGEHYKADIISAIPDGEEVTLYRQGEFIDLCRGPHVPNTAYINAFKLTKVAGAYWRGDSNNEMLQRIYGTAWSTGKELASYLEQLAEAEKRDHRKLGKELDLFHFQDDAPGMVFWHSNGWALYSQIVKYVRRLLIEHSYQEVQTPQIMHRSLWEKSGHWEKFREHMFTTSIDDRDYAIKPMNCPGHVQIFNQGLKSYRDLPLRIAEFGLVHRNEPSGTLHGLMRARRFTQDDAHVFCTVDQLQEEVATLIDLTYKMYNDFGFEDIEVALSTRPKKRVGDDSLWDVAENALAIALESKNIPYAVQEGEGAFYGPKHEFVLRDSIGRRWQCGTIQIDFSMPELLEASYVDATGEKIPPVMIHRAILGS